MTPIATALLVLAWGAAAWPETWMGLEVVTPEDRCAEYDRNDYRYDAGALREALVDSALLIDGRVVGWYSDRHLAPDSVDVDHVVALSEAHDSGLCARPEDRRAFASDPLNLVLADPAINRSKGGRDAGEWLPDGDVRRALFAWIVVAVKHRWGLSVDCNERTVLESIIGPDLTTAVRPRSWGDVKK